MKQITAFVHPHRISSVMEALRNSGVCDINAGTGCHNVTVSTVQRLYTTSNAAQQHYSMELAEPVVAEMKLELLCDESLADQLQQLIVQTARPGIGWVYISDVHGAVKLG